MAGPWPNSSSYRDRPVPRPGLATIVQRAQALTGASGAALALIRNSRREIGQEIGREIECCVRSGRTAPPLGRSALAAESLVAVCIASGLQLWCHDVETDHRMRGAALFDPGIRSLVFTPIAQAGQVIGILAVFAEATDAFSARHLLQLETAAGELSEILGMEGRAASRSLPSTESDTTRPKPPVSARLPVPPREVREATPEPASEPQGKPDAEQGASSIATHRFATLEAMAARPKKPGKLILMAVFAVLVIGGGVTWAYLAMAARSAPAPAAVAPVHVQLPVQPEAGTEAAPSAERAILKIDPEAVGTRKGSTFLLNIGFSHGAFSHGPDIASVVLEINYDPKVMQFISVSEGGFLGQDGRQVVLAHRDDPFAGTLKISAQRPPGSPGVSGDGTVFGLVFWAREKGSGNVSIVPGAADSQGRPVEVAGAEASVVVR